MAAEPVLLIAAGGLARETLAAIRAGGSQHPVGIVDDNPELHGLTVNGVGVLGGTEVIETYPDVRLVVCVGRGTAREAIVHRLTMFRVGPERYASVVHPQSSIAPDTQLGVGCILLAGVVATADVTIGDHVVAMPNVTMTHDDVVRDYATLCAGVSLGGDVAVGRASYLGMNASVRQGVRVGERAVLGMGAVLVSDLPEGQTWVGVPAARLEQPARVS